MTMQYKKRTGQSIGVIFMSKKQYIVEAALVLFSEKGFRQTSVQEIAEEAGISKGSFYRYFPSKTDLIQTMLKDYQDKITTNLLQLERSTSDKQLTLADYIAVELRAWEEHESFFNVLFTEMPHQEDEAIKAIMEELRFTLIHLHQDMLRSVFGGKVSPFIEDLTITLEGILKEYILYFVYNSLPLPIDALSIWISSQLEILIDNLEGTQPFLTALEDMDGEYKTSFLLKQIQIKVTDANLPSIEREKVEDSIQFLVAHFTEEPKDAFLIEAVFCYLKNLTTIQLEIKMLEKLYIQGEKESDRNK